MKEELYSDQVLALVLFIFDILMFLGAAPAIVVASPWSRQTSEVESITQGLSKKHIIFMVCYSKFQLVLVCTVVDHKKLER